MVKVCVFTSTRADFGILTPLIIELQKNTEFILRLFVTGTHLSDAHGYTIQEIEDLKLPIFYEVSLSLGEGDGVSYLGTMSEALKKFTDALYADLPGFAIVLGDRFETLAFSIACNGLGVPLVHLHGGEVTEGALDDAYRHCITKLSLIHFVANDSYRTRVLSLGESPDRVFNVGALGLDNILNTSLLDKAEMERALCISLRREVITVTYHPETLNPGKDKEQIIALLGALEKRIAGELTSIIFTRANVDPGNQEIHAAIEEFVTSHPDVSRYVYSLGMKRYLSLLNISHVVAGNSSSGIIEAPALGTPTVNIGDRQKGREMAPSIFNVMGREEEITEALKKAVLFKEKNAGKTFSVYGDGSAAAKIVKILNSLNFTQFPKKKFYDHRT